MERLVGTSEEEEEEEMEMEVKGEDEGGGNQVFYSQEQEEKIGARRSRPKEEKERTKLRERHRRAITARILAGLRKHGNYNLRVRADINDVIAALAREAGWVVLPDGTTLPSQQMEEFLVAEEMMPLSVLMCLLEDECIDLSLYTWQDYKVMRGLDWFG